MKIWRQGSNFFELTGRPNQQVFILAVEPAQGTHHIADVRAHAKFRHPPDVDGDLHRRHLTTVGTGEHRGIAERVTPFPIVRMRSRLGASCSCTIVSDWRTIRTDSR